MRPISIPSFTLLSVTAAAALLLSACGDKEEPSGDSAAAPADSAAPVVDALAEAASAGAEAGGGVAKPAASTSIESLFELVPAGDDTNFVVVRDPGMLLDFTVAISAFYEQPLAAAAARGATAEGASLSDVVEVAKGYAEVKRRLSAIESELKSGKVDLSRGFVAGLNSKGEQAVLIFGASDAEALRPVLTAFGVPEGEGVCKDLAGAAGYVICADTEAEISAYKPRGKEGGGSLKETIAGQLQGVSLDDVQVIASVKEDELVSMAMALKDGGMTMHVGLPLGESDIAEAREVMTPAKPELLRFVQPGTGFFWTHVDAAAMRKRTPGADSIPPMLSKGVEQLTGEFLFGGSREPAAMQIRVGSGDPTAFQPAFDLALMAKSEIPKTIPGVAGSKIDFDRETIASKGGDITALRLSASGIPMIDELRGRLGFSLDAWVFGADGALSLIVGADAEGIKSLTSGSNDVTASLPPALAKSIGVGETSMIMHMPLDPLHSPLSQSFLQQAKDKGMADVDAESLRMMLGLAGPVSSLSVWATDTGKSMVVHTSVQLIGDPTTEEGKAALDAARSAALGGDPKALFEALATRYPDSPRLIAYKARTGANPGDLIGSAIGGALAGIGAASYFIVGEAQVTPPETVEPAPALMPKDDVKKDDVKKDPKHPGSHPKKKKKKKTHKEDPPVRPESSDNTGSTDPTGVPRPTGPKKPATEDPTTPRPRPKRVGRQPS